MTTLECPKCSKGFEHQRYWTVSETKRGIVIRCMRCGYAISWWKKELKE